MIDRPDIFFQISSDNHDLPLAAILRHSTVFGATMATSLHKDRLVLVLYENLMLDFDTIQPGSQVFFPVFNQLILDTHSSLVVSLSEVRFDRSNYICL